MLRRAAWICLLCAAFAAPAHAQPVEQLLPGVTLARGVQFTPHGPVAFDVITAPRPGSDGGLYQLAPVLAHGTITGPLERVTQIEKDVSASATVAGINGDYTSGTDRHPAGIVVAGGALEHTPSAGRSSIGVDATGTLQVARVRFFGTWQGTGQRRPLDGVNQQPAPGAVTLFTPAYGAKVPVVAGSAEAVLQAFPQAAPNAFLTAAVAAVGTGGGQPIPAGGAVLMADGTAAAQALQAEAPAGATVTTRLILQPPWTGVATALGGGPVVVRGGKPVFSSFEDFTSVQVAERSPRAGVGQLADGRIVLVVVDGDQPGYSSGMTAFELGQTMARLGAVTASAVESGPDVTAAFDGQMLNRPASGPQPVREALLVEYFGVYAAPPPVPLLNGDPGRTVEPLSYKLVRPSTVTAQLIGPDGKPRVVQNAVQEQPGSYAPAFTSYDVEGTWKWDVQATDDLGRKSESVQTFRYDTTLRALTAPRVAHGSAAIAFTLSRPGSVVLRVETQSGVVVRTLPPAALQPGRQSLVWDGTLPHGTRAYGGTYVAHVFATSAVGTSDLAVPFAFRRT
ncbi:MAG TPA: phosphodiester glycosidase family protein [Gaiellaceae bacterium]|nr:phosphodiester glycosidase family protein [Gaiellaceae bacterium]